MINQKGLLSMKNRYNQENWNVVIEDLEDGIGVKEFADWCLSDESALEEEWIYHAPQHVQQDILKRINHEGHILAPLIIKCIKDSVKDYGECEGYEGLAYELVKYDYEYITEVVNPTDEMLALAIKHDFCLLRHFPEVSLEVLTELFAYSPSVMEMMIYNCFNYTNNLLLEGIKRSPREIACIIDFCNMKINPEYKHKQDEVKESLDVLLSEAISRNGKCIAFVKNPNPELQRIAVENDLISYYLLTEASVEEPSEDTYFKIDIGPDYRDNLYERVMAIFLDNPEFLSRVENHKNINMDEIFKNEIAVVKLFAIRDRFEEKLKEKIISKYRSFFRNLINGMDGFLTEKVKYQIICERGELDEDELVDFKWESYLNSLEFDIYQALREANLLADLKEYFYELSETYVEDGISWTNAYSQLTFSLFGESKGYFNGNWKLDHPYNGGNSFYNEFLRDRQFVNEYSMILRELDYYNYNEKMEEASDLDVYSAEYIQIESIAMRLEIIDIVKMKYKFARLYNLLESQGYFKELS